MCFICCFSPTGFGVIELANQVMLISELFDVTDFSLYLCVEVAYEVAITEGGQYWSIELAVSDLCTTEMNDARNCSDCFLYCKATLTQVYHVKVSDAFISSFKNTVCVNVDLTIYINLVKKADTLFIS